MFRDLRFAVRNLNKHLWLSLTVVVTLMLGIGISSGVFAFLDAMILRPQLDKDFDSFAQVYSAYTRDPLRPGTPGNTTLEDFLAFRERSNSLRRIAAWSQVEEPVGSARLSNCDQSRSAGGLEVRVERFAPFSLWEKGWG